MRVRPEHQQSLYWHAKKLPSRARQLVETTSFGSHCGVIHQYRSFQPHHLAINTWELTLIIQCTLRVLVSRTIQSPGKQNLEQKTTEDGCRSCRRNVWIFKQKTTPQQPGRCYWNLVYTVFLYKHVIFRYCWFCNVLPQILTKVQHKCLIPSLHSSLLDYFLPIYSSSRIILKGIQLA